MLFVAPSFLNAALFSQEIKKHKKILKWIMHYNLVQLPSPQFNYFGDHGERTKTSCDTKEFRELCKIHAKETAQLIGKYGADHVKGFLGLSKDPVFSCSKVYREEGETKKIVEEKGIFVEELVKLVQVPVLDVDLENPDLKALKRFLFG